jgi:prepilin-type processing-associated H-X9-DG protein
LDDNNILGIITDTLKWVPGTKGQKFPDGIDAPRFLCDPRKDFNAPEGAATCGNRKGCINIIDKTPCEHAWEEKDCAKKTLENKGNYLWCDGHASQASLSAYVTYGEGIQVTPQVTSP